MLLLTIASYTAIRRLVYNIKSTVEAPVSGHPREAEKVSATGAGRLYGDVQIQSLYELEFKQGFINAAVSRAGRLRECVNTEFV